MRMNKRVLVTFAALSVAIVATARAHTMYLKLESFFLEPHSTNMVQLINGDFDNSENVITRDRMLDVSLVGPGGTVNPPHSAWSDSAVYHWDADSVDTAILTFETGGEGTYVLGVSTAARTLDQTAQEFNDYLVHDGVTDAIAQREKAGKTNDDATEVYSKHVKAILQVGDARSSEWETELGYPIEFMPLKNPYELTMGNVLEVLLLKDGHPVPNQIVYANHEFNHAHNDTGGHVEAVTTRTDGYGIARILLSARGRWYVRTIHLVERNDDPDVDYESNWATLTFELPR